MIQGDTPFIGAADSNNGVTAFIGNENSSADENVLGVNYDGNGMVISFYHPYRCLFSDSVKRFHLKKHAGNEFIYLFLKAVILQQKSKYNYGYKFSEARMRRQKILLPVTDDDTPDYEYMENYIRAVEEEILQRYREFVSIADTAPVVQLKEKVWRAFFIGDLFRIESGKCSQANRLQRDEHGVPYIGATNRNNGVVSFVRPVENLIQRGNCIAFIKQGEGSVGYSIYKAEDFIASTSVALGYADFLNRHVGIFITTVADKVRGRYSFNYPRSETRLRREKLMLPVTADGSPDFEYMAAYVRNIEAAQYRRYLNYIDGE